MAAMDRYLLESGSPDGFLLEDGSGVIVLENSAYVVGLSGGLSSAGGLTKMNPRLIAAAVLLSGNLHGKDLKSLLGSITPQGNSERIGAKFLQADLNLDHVLHASPSSAIDTDPGIPVLVTPAPELGHCGLRFNFDEPDWILFSPGSGVIAEIGSSHGYYDTPNALYVSGNGVDVNGGLAYIPVSLLPDRKYDITVALNGSSASIGALPLSIFISAGFTPVFEFKVNKTDIPPGWRTVKVGTFTTDSSLGYDFSSVLLGIGLINFTGFGPPAGGSWLIDIPSLTFRCQTCEGSIDFSAIEYRSRDGNCLVDYPEEHTPPNSLVDDDACVDPSLTLESAVSGLFSDDDICLDPVLHDDTPAPFTVFNPESDGCPLHTDQVFDYPPPSRGSLIDFIGRLSFRMSDRIYRSSLSFTGSIKRGRKFVASESFVGSLRRKDKKKLASVLAFGGSVTKLKVANVIIHSSVWYKAESLSALSEGQEITTWPDLSGNGNNLTGGGVQASNTNIISALSKPHWHAAGVVGGFTNLPLVSFFPLGAIDPTVRDNIPYCQFASPVVLVTATGWTAFFIVRDFRVLPSGANTFLGSSQLFVPAGAGANDNTGQIGSGSNLSQWTLETGAKAFSGTFAHTDGNDSEVIVLRVAAGGAMDCWVAHQGGSASHLTNSQTTIVSTHRVNFLGRNDIGTIAPSGTGMQNRGLNEVALFTSPFSDAQMAAAAAYGLARLAGTSPTAPWV